jgi:hypothetical protein
MKRNELIYNAELWAEIISASLPTFANPDKDFDIAHKTIVDYVTIIIDAVRGAE